MKHSLKNIIDASLGKVDSDTLITDVQVLDVFSCEWRKTDVALFNGVIVGVDPGLKAKHKIDGRGKFLVPGFIDAHVHVESSMMMPRHFESAILPLGTTSAICDPHEIANVKGVAGIEYFLETAQTLSMDLWVMLSSCVPATHLETNGGGEILADALMKFKNHSRALGLAEMMNMPGVLHADPHVLEKIEAFKNRPIDGHCPLLRGKELSAYAATGISSCHESSEYDEAKEKLIKGISVWVREGSVAKDLEALAPLLNMATSSRMGFCTDDRNPYDIAEQGHINYLIKRAIKKGVMPEVAYRAASLSVANHYGLDRGPSRVGAIAPGFQADLVLLDDYQSCSIHQVFKKGKDVIELVSESSERLSFENSISASVPQASELKAPEGSVHVICVKEGKIITDREVTRHDSPGVMKLSVLERYGHKTPPANGYVRGFGHLNGAIASSVGHDSHNLIVVGNDIKDMQAALGALIECGGGFSVAQNGEVIARLELPLAGLMSAKDPKELKNSIIKLKKASQEIGCTLSEPFLQLAFLSLPVIPSLKLTDQGLVDVDAFKIISVRAS